MKYRNFEYIFSGFLKTIFDLLIIITSGTVVFFIGLFIISHIFNTDVITLLHSIKITDPETVNTRQLIYIQALTTLSYFIFGSFFAALFYSKEPFKYLQAHKINNSKIFLLTFLIVFSLQPVVNFLVYFSNEVANLNTFANLKNYFEQQTQLQQQIIKKFLYTKDPTTLLRNIIIVALLPAIGEEFFFRGILQRHLISGFKNANIGILTTAIIFAFIHFDYSGFYARVLLGIVLGYLFYWSKSIWLSTFLHFINNATAVIIYYIAALNNIEPQTLEQNSANKLQLILLAIIGLAIFFYLITIIRRELNTSNNTEN